MMTTHDRPALTDAKKLDVNEIESPRQYHIHIERIGLTSLHFGFETERTDQAQIRFLGVTV